MILCLSKEEMGRAIENTCLASPFRMLLAHLFGKRHDNVLGPFGERVSLIEYRSEYYILHLEEYHNG